MVHLNCRSWFSFGAGASSPDALAREAAGRGQKALALTDLNTVAGAVRHAWSCQKHGLKPIFGAQLGLDTVPTQMTSLGLLAADQDGYANLCDLLTSAHRNAADAGDRSTPQVSLTSLRGYTEGLFALTGGHDGALSHYLASKQWSKARAFAGGLKDLFGPRLFIEMTHHERSFDNERLRLLLELGQNLNIPTVASNAVRHATREEYAVYDAQICRRLGQSVAQWHEERPRNAAAYLCSATRLDKLGLPATAIANTHAIARECEVSLLRSEVAPPHAHVPAGAGADGYLKTLCKQGLAVRGLHRSRRAKEQLRKETRIVCDLGLEEFFLVVREVVAFARSRGIRCCGRGSAANSLIAFLLGITEVDPLRHRLLFERFLHEGRRGMPDIDVDFESHRRGEVIAWMAMRWGEAHTAMTANVNTYRLRSAVRDFGKVLGYPLPLLDKATKHLPSASVRHAGEFRAELGEVLGEGIALDTLLNLCAALHDGNEASPRHLSLHSGGMVLSREPLRHLSPIQTSANGVRQMQFNKDDVERLGLIKFDVLGLRMLSVVAEATNLLRSVGEQAPDVDALPEGDPQTYDLIRAGQTLGVFQIESSGQWNLLARSQPENFDDLVAQVALFRPGPLQGGVVHPYIARRRGWVKTHCPHPSLEKALEDTYGIIVFQEQVLEVAHLFAGLALGEADEFRRLMSKYRDSEQMEAMRASFVESAIRTHADTPHPVSQGRANHVFDLVAKFVGYGFCRSHAAAFARTVYQSAYLKAHCPAAYMAAVMEHRSGFYPLHTLLEEARLRGVTVLPPCIAWSGVRYSLEKLGGGEKLGDGKPPSNQQTDLAIRVPLTAIKELSPASAADIVLERSLSAYESLDDVFRRVRLRPEAWDNLARSGALDLFGTRREVLWHLGRLHKTKGQNRSLFDATLNLEMPRDHLLMKVTSLREEAVWDFATHSLTTGPHPLALRRPELEKLGAQPIRGLFDLPTGEVVRIAGAVISRQRPPTAKGFTFLILEDETGRVPTALQPSLYEPFASVLREGCLIVEGRLESPPEEKQGKTGVYRSILIEKMWSLNAVTAQREVVGSAGHTGESPRVAIRAA